MPNGYSPSDYAITGAVSGIVTDQPISREFSISAGGSLNFVVKVAISGVNHVGTQTVKLQTAMNGSDWVDSKSATFTANGNVYIKLQTTASGDQTYLPLLCKGRIVLSQTNGSDAATIGNVYVLQDQ